MVTVKEYVDSLKDGKLMGTKCKKCGNVTIPLKPICPKCGSFDVEEFETKGEGIIKSFTVIYVAPKKFEDKAPYAIAIVKLDEGPSIMGRLLGIDLNKADEIKIGTRVKFEPLVENGETIVAFRPVSGVRGAI